MTSLSPFVRSSRKVKSRRENRKAGKRRKRNSIRRRLAWLIFLLAGLTISATILHYYSMYSRWIDALLISNSPLSRVIWAEPFNMTIGNSLTPERLITELHRSGYKQAREGEDGWFRKYPEVIVIRSPRRVLKASFSGSILSALNLNGKDVKSARLNPSFLSSFSYAGRKRHKPLKFEELPSHVINAIVAAEDNRFFSHKGIDLIGLLRATAINLWYWEIRQGGSTLTQQFVKNYFLSSDRLISRKFRELFLALLLEQRLDKQSILLLYLNDVYLGQSGSFAIHGLGHGASIYFRKECRDLTLSEAAVLASMIPAPNKYNPHNKPDLVRKRRNFVLNQMERRGYITSQENQNSQREKLFFRKLRERGLTNAPYFVDFLTRRLSSHSNINLRIPSDIEVFSTLNPALQVTAFQVVQTELDKLEKVLSKRVNPPNLQAALLAVDPRNGHILAMIGGRNYARGQYNRATRALRQPGSTFKPFVFAAALKKSGRQLKEILTLATPVLDKPYTFEHNGEKYSPRNYKDQYSGVVSVRDALALSLNVPTVKVAEWAGLDQVTYLSGEMGFSDRIKPSPSLALGSYEVSLLELMQGYQVLANGGLKVHLKAWTKVKEDENTIKAEYAKQVVISPQTAFLVTSALQTALDQGTGRMVRQLGFKLPAAGKTGTTNDAWFVGYTPDLLCGIWVGSDNSPDLKMSGSLAALPIWTSFMEKARQLGFLSGSKFNQPPGVLNVSVDKRSGLRASRDCREVRNEIFLKGTEPQVICRNHKAALVSKSSKFLLY